MRGDTGGSTSSCWLEVLRQPSQQEWGHTHNSVTCIIPGHNRALCVRSELLMGGGVCGLIEQGLGGSYFQQQFQTRPVQLWSRATLIKDRTLCQSPPRMADLGQA